MKSFNIIRYLKKWWPLIALMSFCAGVFFMRYATSNQAYTAQSIIKYNYSQAEDGKAPSGGELDVSEIFSSSVVKQAIENLDLTVNVDTIRSGGTADALLSRPVDDPESFSKQLFKTFGYTFLTSQLTDGSGSVTGIRSEKGRLIFNASLTLTFSDSSLTGVSGTFLPALDEGRRTDGLDAVDALVHFLDYCSASGVVCTEVRALDEGYLLQTSSASPLRLQGVWRISTDVSRYYVNCKTGEITRE
jgi:hypothetical protein